MDLLESVEKAGATFDLTYSDRPSIDDHPQNIGTRAWASTLIPLLRDSFLELRDRDPNRARHIVDRWSDLPFPLFRRFVFYAMAKCNFFEPKSCLNALFEKNAEWLWAIYTQRESFQLLESLWPKLEEADSTLLISQLLAGPPRELFPHDIDQAMFNNIVEQKIYTRLKALSQTGRALPSNTQARLDELHERWRSDASQPADRDHFPSWSEFTVGGLWHQQLSPEEDLRGKSDEEVLEFLTEVETSGHPPAGWQSVVRDHTERAAQLLLCAANERTTWPVGPWKDLLWAIPGSDVKGDLWNNVCQTLRRFPRVADIADPIASLLITQSSNTTSRAH
jgi:hypothetical protein